MKEKTKKILTGAVVIAGMVAAYSIGKKVGEDHLVEELIHNYEDEANGKDVEWPVFDSRDKQLGDLMYEIKAECIGD